MKVIGDSVFTEQVDITVELNSEKSWLKNGKEIDYLLAHEQGHFDIKRLWGIGLKKALDKNLLPKRRIKVPGRSHCRITLP